MPATKALSPQLAFAQRTALTLWRELLQPLFVAFGLFAIAVGLIEGPAAGAFLYAIF